MVISVSGKARYFFSKKPINLYQKIEKKSAVWVLRLKPLWNGKQKNRCEHFKNHWLANLWTDEKRLSHLLKKKCVRNCNLDTAWLVSHEKNLLELQTLSVVKFCQSLVNESYHSQGVALLLTKKVVSVFLEKITNSLKSIEIRFFFDFLKFEQISNNITCVSVPIFLIIWWKTETILSQGQLLTKYDLFDHFSLKCTKLLKVQRCKIAQKYDFKTKYTQISSNF